MKNVVECPREFLAYFNALETRGEYSITTVFTLIFIASDVMIMLKNEIVHSKK